MRFRRESLPPEPPRNLSWHLKAGMFSLVFFPLLCWIGGLDLNSSAMLLLVVWAIHGWNARTDAAELGEAFWK